MIKNKWTSRALAALVVIAVALTITATAQASQDVVPNPSGDQKIACGAGFTYDLAGLNLDMEKEPTNPEFKAIPVVGCGLALGRFAVDAEVNLQNGDGFLHSAHGGLTSPIGKRMNFRLGGGLKAYDQGAFGADFDRDRWYLSAGLSVGF